MEKTARAIIVDEFGLYTLYREKVVNGVRRKYYAIPGGHKEDGETLEETVIRELNEELGIEIEVKAQPILQIVLLPTYIFPHLGSHCFQPSAPSTEEVFTHVAFKV